jgi:hypothetical protein
MSLLKWLGKYTAAPIELHLPPTKYMHEWQHSPVSGHAVESMHDCSHFFIKRESILGRHRLRLITPHINTYGFDAPR